MSAYTALRDVSNNFENELRQVSSQLFSAQIGEKIEDVVSNKIRDMKLYSSKLKLLQANPLSLSPQVSEQDHDNIHELYEETVAWKLLEQMTVKSLTQTHAVKTLISTPDYKLDTELIERKKAIIHGLHQFHKKETELHDFDNVLKEREATLALLRADWDSKMEQLRDASDQQDYQETRMDRGPLYKKLSATVDKLEIMRWLIGRLACVRGGYDWLADPHRRLAALALTRTHNTIDTFTQDE